MGTALPQVNTGEFVSAVALGDSSTCAILAEGTVRCWGANGSGQLGYGDTAMRGATLSNFPILQLGGKVLAIGMAGSELGKSARTCAVLEEGSVKCWGANDYLTADGGVDEAIGRLGYGDTISRGAAPNQMGTNLPAIDLGDVSAPREVVVGAGHTCVRFEGRKVKCFGENFSGALGLGDSKNRGFAPEQMGNDLPFVDLGR